MVRRTDFNSVEGLLELALEPEQTLENAKTFRPPPLPAAASLPEMAYKSPLTDTQKRQNVDAKEGKVSTVGEKDPKYENLEDLLWHVLKQSLSKRGSPGVERSGKNTSARQWDETMKNGQKSNSTLF